MRNPAFCSSVGRRLLPGLLIGALACQAPTDAPTAPGTDAAPAISALAVNFSQVEAGGRHSCALVADGRIG